MNMFLESTEQSTSPTGSVTPESIRNTLINKVKTKFSAELEYLDHLKSIINTSPNTELIESAIDVYIQKVFKSRFLIGCFYCSQPYSMGPYNGYQYYLPRFNVTELTANGIENDWLSGFSQASQSGTKHYLLWDVLEDTIEEITEDKFVKVNI